MSGRAQRYHSLDALRAAMMLLGIVLHSAASYMAAPLGAAWPYKDSQTSGAFDLLVFFIHLFRMPVFFVAAGLFGALLMERGGVRPFVANRAKRVLLPLALFWPLVFITVAAGFIYATRRGGNVLDLAELETGSILRRPMLAHLWFLWDLTIFYAAAALIVPVASRVLGAAWGARIDAVFARRATTIGGVLAMSAITAVTLLLDRQSPIVRYLSDASYWMYIVHLPIVIAVPGVLAPSPLPAVVKFAITLTVTTAATLVTYHYLVRSTTIGALLNGRRYPRSLPTEVGVRSPGSPRGSGLQIRRARGLTPRSVDLQT